MEGKLQAFESASGMFERLYPFPLPSHLLEMNLFVVYPEYAKATVTPS